MSFRAARRRRAWVQRRYTVAIIALCWGCTGGSAREAHDAGAACEAGTAGCRCLSGGGCFDDLLCSVGACLAPEGLDGAELEAETFEPEPGAYSMPSSRFQTNGTSN